MGKKLDTLTRLSKTEKTETEKATEELLRVGETAPRPKRAPGRKKNPDSENYIPMTFRIERGRLDKLRTLARIYGTSATRVLEQAIDLAIGKYETDNGEISTDSPQELTIF